MMLSNVDFPHPLGPTSRNKLAIFDSQCRRFQRVDHTVTRLKTFADARKGKLSAPELSCNAHWATYALDETSLQFGSLVTTPVCRQMNLPAFSDRFLGDAHVADKYRLHVMQ